MSGEIPQTAERSFEENRFDYYKKQNQATSSGRTYSPVPVSYCKYSTWIFTALLVAGAVIILFGVAALISARGGSLPILNGIDAIGEGGAIGIIVGGGLMSFAGMIGIFRNFFQSQREEIQRYGQRYV